MFGGRVSELVAVNAYFQAVFRINMKVKSALMQAIYSKVLRLSSDGMAWSFYDVIHCLF
jgi:hypothetical protein